MAGQLVLCATPIGNLGDISARVLEALRGADLIAAEDTRNSRKLMTHFDIHTPMISYHENNRFDRGRELTETMREGVTVALITDAGTPAISDPGEELVRMACEAGITVTSLPGPAACITALTLSALPAARFSMQGFLPRRKKDRDALLADIRDHAETQIFYEAPHRLRETILSLAEILGAERRIAVCRELTKVHEEVLRMTLGEAASYVSGEQDPGEAPPRAEEGAARSLQNPRGEYVLVVEGRDHEAMRAQERAAWEEMSVEEHVARYIGQGMTEKGAMKQAARDRGCGKREIYAALKG